MAAPDPSEMPTDCVSLYAERGGLCGGWKHRDGCTELARLTRPPIAVLVAPLLAVPVIPAISPRAVTPTETSTSTRACELSLTTLRPSPAAGVFLAAGVSFTARLPMSSG
jgi:hypothetical protein